MNLQLHCVIRRDLGFNVGLMSAQVAHLAMQQMRNHALNGYDLNDKKNHESLTIKEWLPEPVIIVHEVPCKEALEFYMEKSRTLNVKIYDWRDTVYVSLGSKKEALQDVLVGFAFEVTSPDKVKAVIGDLPLLS